MNALVSGLRIRSMTFLVLSAKVLNFYYCIMLLLPELLLFSLGISFCVVLIYFSFSFGMRE